MSDETVELVDESASDESENLPGTNTISEMAMRCSNAHV